MESNEDLEIILEQIEAPAFLVTADSICAVNSSAAQYGITLGQNIFDLIFIGQEEYRNFNAGNLYLTISNNGAVFDCSVSKLQKSKLFILEEKPQSSDLQLLSLAAKQFSFPLSELSVLLSKAEGIETADGEKISRILFQLQRITGNMSDAAHLKCNPQSMQTVEICSIMEEILEKSKVLFSHTPIELSYSLPNTPMYAPASPELIERAVYNLLSNAAKYGTNKISASLSQKDGKAYFTMVNSLNDAVIRQGFFTRYKRAPGLEDPRYGLGLGMTMVHAIAKAHGGTVLIEATENGEIKITFSLSQKMLKNMSLRSPILKPDIYGGRDRALVELSDVLPPELYSDCI